MTSLATSEKHCPELDLGKLHSEMLGLSEEKFGFGDGMSGLIRTHLHWPIRAQGIQPPLYTLDGRTYTLDQSESRLDLIGPVHGIEGRVKLAG